MPQDIRCFINTYLDYNYRIVMKYFVESNKDLKFIASFVNIKVVFIDLFCEELLTLYTT